MSDAQDFVGLSKKGAQDKAEAKNLVFRLVAVDGETFLGWPDDSYPQRVCCVIEKGKVTEARFG